MKLFVVKPIFIYNIFLLPKGFEPLSRHPKCRRIDRYHRAVHSPLGFEPSHICTQVIQSHHAVTKQHQGLQRCCYWVLYVFVVGE